VVCVFRHAETNVSSSNMTHPINLDKGYMCIQKTTTY